MKTIREVWIDNLTRLIGNRSLKEVSTDAKIPYSTLRNMLQGHLAEGVNLAKLTAYFGVPETHLFVDLQEFEQKRSISPQVALAVLQEAIVGPNLPLNLSARLRGISAEKLDNLIFLLDLLDQLDADDFTNLLRDYKKP